MSGLFTRIKTWIDDETIEASDLNAEFDNQITNAIPSKIDDYSTNAAQMKTATDPGSTGSESLATTLAGEIERIRYAIRRIVDKTNWYDAPDSTLSTSATKLAMYLPFDSDEDQATTTTGALGSLISRGGIINASSFSSQDVAAADFDSANKKFGTYSYITGSGNLLAYPGRYNEPYIGTFNCHFRNIFSEDYIAFNPLLGMELFLDSSGYLKFRYTERTPNGNNAKATNEIVGSVSRASNANFQQVSAKWRVGGQAGAGTDLMQLELDNTDEGTQLDTQTINVNPGRGGNWFFGCKKNDPTWVDFQAMNVTPDNDGWAATGTAGAGTVSDGVLTIATTGTETLYYTHTGATIDLSAFTLEFKARLLQDSATFPRTNTVSFVRMRDDDLDRNLNVRLLPDFVLLESNNSITSYKYFYVNTSEFHVYRIVSEGTPSPTVTLYVDGVSQGSYVLDDTSSTGADSIYFGDTVATAGENMPQEWEFLRYANTAAHPLAAGSATGNLDDIIIANEVISDTVLTNLNSTQASSVFGTEAKHGITMPNASGADDSATSITGTAWTEFVENIHYLMSDGKTPMTLEMQTRVSPAAGAATTTVYALIIDDHYVREMTRIVTEANNQAHLSLTVQPSVYPMGLHKVSLWGSESGSASLTVVPSTFRIWGELQ